jgi:hypothetical protein
VKHTRASFLINNPLPPRRGAFLLTVLKTHGFDEVRDERGPVEVCPWRLRGRAGGSRTPLWVLEVSGVSRVGATISPKLKGDLTMTSTYTFAPAVVVGSVSSDSSFAPPTLPKANNSTGKDERGRERFGSRPRVQHTLRLSPFSRRSRC